MTDKKLKLYKYNMDTENSKHALLSGQTIRVN